DQKTASSLSPSSATARNPMEAKPQDMISKVDANDSGDIDFQESLWA
ncbi:Os11g0588766, partial [Oryza sativa Japonica Group]